MPPVFSVIIPYKKSGPALEECLSGLRGQSFRDFEVLLLPDSDAHDNIPGTRIIPTGEVTPAAKRNTAIAAARGAYLAFIDSDAIPGPRWLAAALPLFDDPLVSAVGGPNVTNEPCTPREKAGGDVLENPLVAGPLRFRYVAQKPRLVTELPACNLIVRKRALGDCGLIFDEKYLTAEDSKLCFLLRASGGKLLYSPQVVVRHCRRGLFLPHLRQVWGYGRDKGRLAREMSWEGRWRHYLPLLLVLGLACSAAAWACGSIAGYYFISAAGCYLLAAAIAGLRSGWRRAALVSAGIVLTHIAYGTAFLGGLASGSPGGRS